MLTISRKFLSPFSFPTPLFLFSPHYSSFLSLLSPFILTNPTQSIVFNSGTFVSLGRQMFNM